MTIDAGVTSNVFLRRASHPAGDFEQQFPALRPQSEHRQYGSGRERPGNAESDADGVP